MIKFSIIVPIYNSEKYIARCIESVINQTYDDYELLLINDGSTDKSLEICNEYKSTKIKVFDKQNEGVCETRNLGLSLSSGDFIIFLDSDDWLEITTLEKISKIIKESPKIDLLKFNYFRESKTGSNLNRVEYLNIKYDYLYEREKYNKVICEVVSNSHFLNSVWGLAIKKEIIGCVIFEKGIIYGEDLLFNVNLFKKASSIYFIEECLYHYYANDDGVSLNLLTDVLKKKIENLLYIYPLIINALSKMDENCVSKIQDKEAKELTECLVKMYSSKNNKDYKLKYIKGVREEKASVIFDKIDLLKYKNYKYFIPLYLMKKKHFILFSLISKFYKMFVFIKRKK